ncbi:hypothetical protein P691DRAFT_788340 [Macrolepiota fuliginosa MF-IS2]|uniref:Uncharacterized protein n=1 Tax=Macrolepiota fuliginosa MF-IS2 TaxID=1400762 RepID=A0A9P5X3X7_9AGAR|nr:hypothetical protein P691DRAFT_788340 [Macrolepiota fuliginosa MF-IS2]
MAKTPITKAARSKVTGVKPTGTAKTGTVKQSVIETEKRQSAVKECREPAGEQEGEAPLGEGAIEEVKGLKYDRKEETSLQEEAVADIGVTEAVEENSTALQEGSPLQVPHEMSVTPAAIGDPQVLGQNVLPQEAIAMADAERAEISFENVNVERSKDLCIPYVEGEEQPQGGIME